MLSDKKYVTIELSRSRLKERKHELASLLELSNLLSEPFELDVLLEKALSLVLGEFGLDAGRVYLMDFSAGLLVMAGHVGMDIVGLEEVHLDEGFSGESARTRSFIAQHVSELADKERAALLAAKGLKIIICMPLIVMDRVLGVLNLAAKKNIGLTEEDVDLMMIMAHQIGVASGHARAYQALQERIREIEEKNETIKFFAYSASHDLKSPAVGLCGLMERLHTQYRDALDDKGKAYCDQLLKTSRQILLLVEQITAYIGAREAPLNVSICNGKEMVHSLKEEFSKQLLERKVTWNEPEVLPNIMADELRVTRIFRNLVDNALKYGGNGLTRIRIGYEDRGESHVFSVGDDGVGMRKEVAGQLFRPFQRQETSKGTEGSGMGLSIAKEIAKRHDGDIWVASEPGRGTTFYFSVAKRLRSLPS